MKVIGCGTETYLYINGISTSNEILLHDNVMLIPATKHFHYGKVSKLLKNDAEFAVAALSGRTIASQIRITASDAKELACVAWNAAWDSILLGAIFHCEVMGNVQCDKPIEQLRKATNVNITNYHFRALFSEPYRLTPEDEKWIRSYYSVAYGLLEKGAFETAVHAMASYKWHSMPRVQLAILWSGIEALFEASTEISFRISLYIANFLAGGNTVEANKLFKKTKKLYASRSAAVHGGKVKGEVSDFVAESATLLNRIIRRCAELGSLPDTENLVFPVVSTWSTELPTDVSSAQSIVLRT